MIAREIAYDVALGCYEWTGSGHVAEAVLSFTAVLGPASLNHKETHSLCSSFRLNEAFFGSFVLAPLPG